VPRGEAERQRITQDADELRAQIAEHQRVVADPAAAAAATGARIQTGIEGQRPQQQAVARAKYVNPPR